MLRGINIGGNNKVSMAELAKTFASAGLKDVKTYINSGNIIFSDELRSNKQLVRFWETLQKKILGFT